MPNDPDGEPYQWFKEKYDQTKKSIGETSLDTDYRLAMVSLLHDIAWYLNRIAERMETK